MLERMDVGAEEEPFPASKGVQVLYDEELQMQNEGVSLGRGEEA